VGLEELIEKITILINRAPKPMLSPADGNHDLIQMQDIMMAVSCGATTGHRRGRISGQSADGFVGHQCRAPTASARPVAG
jgi:hypothetical protein